MNLLIRLLDRLVPALLMAASVSLLTAGVLSYAPSAFGDWQTPEPTTPIEDPLFDPGVAAVPTPTGDPSIPTLEPGQTPRSTPPSSFEASPAPGSTDSNFTPAPGEPTSTPAPDVTPKPGATPAPTPAPTNSAPSVRASRIRIASLGIDLPVVPGDLHVSGNVGNYPLCDVAMYLTGFVQPGEAGTTYLYAHAQEGMFAPLLRESYTNNGSSMIGALVQVYTNDNKLHLYEITRVKRHATDLSITRIPAGDHLLVLQTSEGWHGHVPKLQIAARPIAVVAAKPGEANPVPHPRVCLPR